MSKPNVRSQAIIAAVATLLFAFAAIGTTAASDWIGKPFPGFLVLGNGVVASAGLPDWPATRDGSIFQARVVSVDARPIERPTELQAIAREAGPGERLAYGFVRGDVSFQREIATRRFSARDALLIFGAYLINGLFLGGVALLVLARSRPGQNARKAVPFLVCAALWGLSGMDLYGTHVLFRPHALLEALLFATALQLALEFPSPLFEGPGRRQLVVGGYAGAGLLAVAYQTWLFDPEIYAVVHLLATSLGGVALLLVVLSLMLRFVLCESRELRTALRVMAVGACLALLLPVLLTLPEARTGGTAPQNVVAWTVFIFPLAIAYATCWGNEPSAGTARA